MPGYYILTNTATGHFYIGSSENPAGRAYDHKSKLIRGIHANRKFQLVFTAWEHINVEFFDTDTIEEARIMEQRLLDQHHGSLLCCNQATSVSDPTAGVITADMRRANVAYAHAATKGIPKTTEHRELLSMARTGITHTDETRNAISNSKSRPVEIDGKQYTSLAAAAKELGINTNTLRSRFQYKGKSGKYSGYRFL